MPAFQNQQERQNAEKLLREGAYKGSYTAAGFACMVDRLDQLIAITQKNAEGRS